MLNIKEFEEQAAGVMSRETYEFFVGGAGDEQSIRENVEAFARIFLRPRVLNNVKTVAPECSLFGKNLALPIIAAPMAFQQLAHPDGELAMGRAAASAKIGFTLSLNATKSIEDVAKAAPDLAHLVNWFQLYVLEDRGLTKEIIQRAEAAGFNGLVVTVDRPVRGKRDRDIKNQFHIPANIRSGILKGGFAAGNTPQGGNFSGSNSSPTIDPSLSWKDLEWLRSNSKLKLILKGVLHPDDANRAVAAGVDGIIVSNHGARNLDGVIPPIEALEPIVQAVQGRLEIVVDSGIRRGTDIIKCLARGAKAVMLGRPLLWGLAAGGQDGVAKVLSIIEEEFRIAMALTGNAKLSDIKHDLLYVRD